jgi:hypothetical protein
MMKEELQKKISRLPGNAMRPSPNCRKKLVMTRAIESSSAKAKQFISDSPAKP